MPVILLFVIILIAGAFFAAFAIFAVKAPGEWGSKEPRERCPRKARVRCGNGSLNGSKSRFYPSVVANATVDHNANPEVRAVAQR